LHLAKYNKLKYAVCKVRLRMGSNFGRRMRELRESKELTQVELARLCEIGDSTISFYESGKREPHYKVLLCIAEKLGTTPNYLLTDKIAGADNEWCVRNSPPSEIDLENFIREQPNLRIFGDPVNEEIKDDMMLALRTVWEVLKKDRAAKKLPKGK
jgi:transcriptional regulator with XRE-family HTH domain